MTPFWFLGYLEALAFAHLLLTTPIIIVEVEREREG